MEENEDECACFIRLQDFEGSLDRQFFVGLQGGFGDNKKRQSKHPQKTDRPVQYLYCTGAFKDKKETIKT